VEKNPNAVVTLQNRVVADGWQGVVSVVPADMREWEAPEQADILVRWAVSPLAEPPLCALPLPLYQPLSLQGPLRRLQSCPSGARRSRSATRSPATACRCRSELLGSFGDNELSPECLDGAQRFLRPDGVSIPQAYTSQLQPITAHKLWNDVKVRDAGAGGLRPACSDRLHQALLAAHLVAFHLTRQPPPPPARARTLPPTTPPIAVRVTTTWSTLKPHTW
jgi:hypothetical protein